MNTKRRVTTIPLGPTNDLVPKKFWGISGIANYPFQVRALGHETLWLTKAKPSVIRPDLPSVACSFIRGERVEHVLIPERAAPKICEAIRLLARLSGETPRIERYIDVYRAYECLVSKRDIDYASLRHALAHASSSLTRPATVNSLKARFGTLEVDPRCYEHQKELYRCMGGMLIEIDRAMFETLVRQWRSWETLSQPRRGRNTREQLRLFG